MDERESYQEFAAPPEWLVCSLTPAEVALLTVVAYKLALVAWIVVSACGWL